MLSFATGDVAFNFYWRTFDAFLLIFYTDVFGLSAAAVGGMFLVTRIWDAISDPLMGMLADRTRSRFGRYRPYLLWLSFPLAASGVLCFTTPDLGDSGKLIWAYCTYILMMTLYTAVNIPYSALMGVMTSEPKARNRLSSIRFVGAFTGGLIVQKTTIDLVKFFGGEMSASGWQKVMMLYGFLATVLLLVCFAFTRERVKAPPKEEQSMRRDLAALSRNVPWMALFATSFFVIMCFSVRGAIAIYYFRYVVGDISWIGWYLSLGSVASIIGAALTPYLVATFGKRPLYLGLMACLAVLSCGFHFIDPSKPWQAVVLNVAIGLVIGPKSPLVWSMYADTADYSELKSGVNTTGLVFSAATFSQKVGIALGGALTAWLLGKGNYQPNAAQSEETLQWIVNMLGAIPAGFAVIAGLLIFVYPLTDKQLPKIEEALKEKRRLKEAASI